MSTNSAVRRIAGNSGWLLLGKIAALALNFSVTVVVARYFGPASFGLFSYCLAAAALLAPVSEMGLVSIVTRDLVREREAQGEILGTVLAIRLVAGICVFVIVSGVLYWLAPSEATTRIYVGLLLFGGIFRGFFVFSFWFEANLQGRVIAQCEVALAVLLGAAKLAVVQFDGPLVSLVIVQSLEGLIVAACFVLAFTRHGRGVGRLKLSMSRALKLVRQGMTLLAGSLTAVIYLKVDQVMLGHMKGSAEVGVYAVAARLSEVWYFVPTAIVASAFPLLLQAQAKSSQRYESRLQNLMDVLCWLGIVVACLVFVSGPYVVERAFGTEYAGAATVLSIHVWAGVFVAMRALASKWLLAESLLAFSFWSQVSGAACNVILNLLLIPSRGAVGAALATLISYAVASYLSFLVIPQTRRIAHCMHSSLAAPIRFAQRVIGKTPVRATHDSGRNLLLHGKGNTDAD